MAPSGDVTSFTGAQPANANSNGDPADQFVAKHFPTGWFTSLTGESAGTQNGVTYPAQPALNEPTTPEYDGPGAPTNGATDTNCDANHVANLDDPTYGLAHDLSLPANEVPAFNWITPNNCSDAHDATCQGNNLSGAFNANGTPNYTPAGLPADDPEATTPINYTGGLYASDLFLRYYIPMIEQSAAFADGGLIDITFDEANPPFTIGNSFNNVPAPGDSTTYSAPADQPTFGAAGTTVPGADSLYGAYGALADAAGENINGQNVTTEPTGPNDPEVTNSSGDQLQPGPGASGFIDRPTGLPGESPNLSGSPGAATEPAWSPPSSSLVTDSKINADDTGRLVSGTDGNGNTIPPDTFVGAVSDTGPIALSGNASTTTASNNYAKPWIGTFQLLNDSGQPVTLPNGFDGNVTLGAEGATSTVGSEQLPERQRGGHDQRLRHGRPALRPHRLHPGRWRHRHRADQPTDQAGHRVEHLLQPLQHAAHAGGPAPDRADLHRALQRRHPAGRGHGLRRPRRPGPHRLRRPGRSGRLRSRRVHRAALHTGRPPSGLSGGQPAAARPPCTARSTSTSGSGATTRKPEPAASAEPAVPPERRVAGATAVRAATAATGPRRPAPAVTAATAATAPARPRNGSTASG